MNVLLLEITCNIALHGRLSEGKACFLFSLVSVLVSNLIEQGLGSRCLGRGIIARSFSAGMPKFGIVSINSIALRQVTDRQSEYTT